MAHGVFSQDTQQVILHAMNLTDSKRMLRIAKCRAIHHPLRNEQHDAMFSLL